MRNYTMKLGPTMKYEVYRQVQEGAAVCAPPDLLSGGPHPATMRPGAVSRYLHPIANHAHEIAHQLGAELWDGEVLLRGWGRLAETTSRQLPARATI